MAGDYMPHAEMKLGLWADNFVGFVEAHGAELGLTPAEIADLQSMHERFDTARETYQDAQTAANVACADKDDAKADIVKCMRSISMRMKAHPGFDRADYAAVGLSTGEPRWQEPFEKISDRPVAIVDMGNRLKHVLTIQNNSGGTVIKRKPSGAIGCEIWRKIGDPPAGPSDLEFVGIALGKKFTVDFSAETAGQQAYYMLRWMSKKSERGEWSPTASATIAA
jgi:hypothetical protein